MRVAIIGAGTVGSAPGKAAVTAGHTVSVSATSPKKAAAVGATEAAQTLQRNLPNNPVVKAFSTVSAGRLGNPVEQGRHVH
ncbi:NAD(P)-binding domain-containing protein [Streptomyces sp. YS-B37]|uniref:NAD(P)-binding domain-containing protein n=1 Tax=Streptomyces sp. YS-B37 TaxID=3407669 RepID=UPI003B50F65A